MRNVPGLAARLIGFVAVVGLACSLSGQPGAADSAEVAESGSDAAQDEPTEIPAATNTPAPTPQPRVQANGDEPVQIRGDIDITSDVFVTYVHEFFVTLQDMTGFINRDFEYEHPLEPQVLGPAIVDDNGEYSYLLNLPSVPLSPLNDVDNDGSSDDGVMVWQVVFTGNIIDDPFLKENEMSGWRTVYTSAEIDTENEDEVIGGALVIWAPDDQQGFPTGFGDDGLLFTDDDPTGPVPAGYSIADLTTDPFTIYQDRTPDLPLLEGPIRVNDYTDMSWTEAFETLFAKVSREYPFSEQKDLDWDAIYDEVAPRVARAEERNDQRAYYLALRELAWAVPDGHVSLSGNDFDLYRDNNIGGYGIGLVQLSDGRVIVNQLVPNTPATDVGIELGAEVVEWNGMSIDEALAQVEPWEGAESSVHVQRLKALQYLTRGEMGEAAEVTFVNPDGSLENATMNATFEVETLINASFFTNVDFADLPISYETLPNGVGYIRSINLFDDLSLIYRIWERAIAKFIANEAPAIIIDIRENRGGSPQGTGFAGYFVQEDIDLSRSYYYSDDTGEFETYGPPNRIEPDGDLFYSGDIILLISPACASACEDVAYVLGQLPQTQIVGYYPTMGIFGEVAQGRYELPGGYSMQFPTGMVRDLDGNIIIEDTGVEPDIVVPITEESVFYQGDYLLDFVLQRLGQ